MSAATAIARKDWREFVRDRRLLLMALLTGLLAIAAIVTSAVRVSSYEADRRATEASDRTTWEGQGARNPHSAAHFSNWAFRPLTAGALLDPGVSPFAGNAVWMEAHNQNPARNRPIEDSAGSFDFGQFSAAWILQTLVPLLLFVIAAGLVARERERGTLRLMLASGARANALIPGKVRAVARICALLVMPIVVVTVMAALLIAGGGAAPLLLALWALAYIAFFAVIAGLAVAVSARTRTVSQAMLLLIGLWLAAVVLIPRAGAGIAEAVAPTPSADAFWAQVSEGRESQADVFGKDADAFGAAMAKRYGVGKAEDLPVSLGGLQLEEDERLGNIVYDRQYGALARTYATQRNILRLSGLFSPLAPIQNISMALAGTDTAHQLDFQRQAEAHRRRIVTQMNTDMIAKGAGKDFDYLADPSFWKTVPAFEYRPPTIATVLRTIWPDFAILLGWLGIAALLVAAASRRVVREAL